MFHFCILYHNNVVNILLLIVYLTFRTTAKSGVFVSQSAVIQELVANVLLAPQLQAWLSIDKLKHLLRQALRGHIYRRAGLLRSS